MREIISKCQNYCESLIMNAEESIPEWEWGIDTGNEVLRIGWGCPLDAPIRSIPGSIGGEALGYINYFLPIAELSMILTGWVVAVGAYYLASVVLRWIKAIS